MAEVELNDIPTKELAAVSPVTPKAEEKGLIKNETNPVASTSSAAPAAETVRGDPSPSPTPCPNPVKMPQASAMKRTDAQQNGEAFLNRDDQGCRRQGAYWQSAQLSCSSPNVSEDPAVSPTQGAGEGQPNVYRARKPVVAEGRSAVRGKMFTVTRLEETSA
ncbi:hypothetical protein COCON_G00123460 [Conger conger]|uniref:Uncharacterized protein n=1 Tax=Conger conger TaxID=82655 RepID=A0A9Q1HZ70_CONCO|nr:hypothetical protein COCON_G00123460 [Conger conger]